MSRATSALAWALAALVAVAGLASAQKHGGRSSPSPASARMVAGGGGHMSPGNACAEMAPCKAH